MKTSELMKLIANGLAHEKNGHAKTASAGRELLRLAGKVEELERTAMLAALPEADAIGQAGECTAPNWLNHFDAMQVLIHAFRYNVANAGCVDERLPRSIAAAWPELPQDVRNIIRATLEKAFDEIDKMVNAKYGYYSGVALYHREWEKVKAAWEKNGE